MWCPAPGLEGWSGRTVTAGGTAAGPVGGWLGSGTRPRSAAGHDGAGQRVTTAGGCGPPWRSAAGTRSRCATVRFGRAHCGRCVSSGSWGHDAARVGIPAAGKLRGTLRRPALRAGDPHSPGPRCARPRPPDSPRPRQGRGAHGVRRPLAAPKARQTSKARQAPAPTRACPSAHRAGRRTAGAPSRRRPGSPRRVGATAARPTGPIRRARAYGRVSAQVLGRRSSPPRLRQGRGEARSKVGGRTVSTNVTAPHEHGGRRSSCGTAEPATVGGPPRALDLPHRGGRPQSDGRRAIRRRTDGRSGHSRGIP